MRSRVQTKDIEFGDAEGTVVVGITRSGKTFGALRSLSKQGRGVLFVNTNNSPVPRGWTRASMGTDTQHMADELIGGGKIAYTPDRRYRQQEVAALIAWLFDLSELSPLDIYVAVDEVHLYSKAALNACIELATTGISHGLKPVWISQRPAMIHNTLITQATNLIAYDLSPAERRWLDQYRYPAQEIYDRLRAVDPPDYPKTKSYGYIVYDGRQVQGAYKVAN